MSVKFEHHAVGDGVEDAVVEAQAVRVERVAVRRRELTVIRQHVRQRVVGCRRDDV